MHHLDGLAGRDRRVLVDARYARYRRMGEFAVVSDEGESTPRRGGWAERIAAPRESGRGAISGRDGLGTLPDVPIDEELDLPLREDV